MGETTVYVQVRTPDDVREAIEGLPGLLANGNEYIAEGFRNGLAFGLLSKIAENFEANSEAGRSPDVDLKWPPLAPSTIERRLHGTEHRRRMTQKARTQDLTAAQKQALRKRINVLKSAYIAAGMDASAALGAARSVAYGELRRQGAKIPTSRQLTPILRDTGIGFNGLSPASFDERTGAYEPPHAGINPDTGQPIDPIWENHPGELTVGVRGYMAYHHEGTERLPRRRLWPDPKEWPAEWWEHLGDVTRQLLVRAAVEVLRAGGVRVKQIVWE